MLQKLIKKFLQFFFVVSVSIFVSLIIPKSLGAEKCTASNWKDDCHSLRPYPAKILNPDDKKEPTAEICGNSIFVSDPITAYANPNSCTRTSGGAVCNYFVHREFIVGIDLKDAELPIMGNTEDVVNRITNEDSIENPKKVNEYLSWYLNGVINRAEYPFLGDQDLGEYSKIINFSGPLRKLLPERVQNDIRGKTIERASSNVSEKDKLPNQKVACVGNLLDGTWFGLPTACYKTTGIIDPTGKRLNDWDNHTPPKRENFEDFISYWIAYIRWRGESCLSIKIPFINFRILICFDNFFKPNFYSNLFPYIPFSSTEDREGKANFGYAGSETGDDIKILNPKLDPESPTSDLYFSHMKENDELASILQATYIPKKTGSSSMTDIIPPTIEYGCKILEIRSNDGDNLFANKSLLEANFSYDTEFSCSFSQEEFQYAIDHGLSLECKKTPTLIFGVNTKTPLADSVWEKLVAGSTSVFRRFFPKNGMNSVVYGIHDIPGSTRVSYASNNGTSLRYKEGDIYFPHIGGISEYFLKGIQTALRPKGFGEKIISGQPDPNYTEPINCNKSAPTVSLPRTLGIEAMYDLAIRWVSGNAGNHVRECYNDVAGRSKSKGINPAFAFTIWLNESNASNYNVSVQDFGINDSFLFHDFNGQIERFLSLPSNNKYSSCMSQPVWNSPMEGFLSVFRTGKCDPNDPRVQYYIAVIKPVFEWVAPGCPFPNSPNDNSCY